MELDFSYVVELKEWPAVLGKEINIIIPYEEKLLGQEFEVKIIYENFYQNKMEAISPRFKIRKDKFYFDEGDSSYIGIPFNNHIKK